MSKSNFYTKLSKLRAKIKEKRKKELYDMINDENNKLEDKIALIKMSLSELGGKELSDSFKTLINNENKTKKE